MEWRLLVLLPLAACATQGPVRTVPHAPPRQARGDIGRTFATVDEAALAACDYIWANHPLRVKYEHGTCIYTENKLIKVALPETVYDPGFCRTPEPPLGAILVGEVHSHTSREAFSDTDTTTRRKIPQYICTPSGAVYRREVSGEITRLK